MSHEFHTDTQNYIQRILKEKVVLYQVALLVLKITFLLISDILNLYHSILLSKMQMRIKRTQNKELTAIEDSKRLLAISRKLTANMEEEKTVDTLKVDSNTAISQYKMELKPDSNNDQRLKNNISKAMSQRQIPTIADNLIHDEKSNGIYYPLDSNLDAKILPREPEISNHKRVSNFINKFHLVEE